MIGRVKICATALLHALTEEPPYHASGGVPLLADAHSAPQEAPITGHSTVVFLDDAHPAGPAVVGELASMRSLNYSRQPIPCIPFERPRAIARNVSIRVVRQRLR